MEARQSGKCVRMRKTVEKFSSVASAFPCSRLFSTVDRIYGKLSQKVENINAFVEMF